METSRGEVRIRNGIKVPYLTQGDPNGVPVVLLHGWGESKDSFDRLLGRLPATLRAFAIDLRGHGDADKGVTHFGLTTLAEDVEEFMEATQLDRAVVVGSSSGGYLAQELAVTAPARVISLVLAGSPFTLQARPPFADEVEALEDPIDPAWVREFVAGFSLTQPVPQLYIEQRVSDGLRLPAAVWKASLTGLTSSTPPTEHGTITAPTLLLWGANDEFVDLDQQFRLESAIPHTRRVVYEDTGHLVLWERPDRIAADLEEFVTSQLSR